MVIGNYDQDTIQRLLDDMGAAGSNIEYTALYLAVRNGYEGVQLLLENGANIEAKTKAQPDIGYTALHLAAKGGYEEVVRLLISGGANIDARTKSVAEPCEFTAVQLAAGCGYRNVVELHVLVIMGARIS